MAIAALSGALVGAVLAGSAIAALRRESAALALEAGPAGAVAMGSDLERAGGALDCAGAAVTPGGRGCSLFQKRLGDATLVVPQNGVVRRWAVRSSIGELALAVLRRRGSGYFQVARSRNEFVTDAGVHTFAADLAVDQGDRLALMVVAGSGAGVRPAGGATTGRWTSGRAPAASGPAGELLLHVDVLPGVTQSVPPQVVGTGADKLPEGDVISRAIVRLGSGAQAEVVLLTVAGHGALDLRRDGRRVARIDVTDMPPKGVTLIEMTADADPSGPEALTINLEFVHTQSDRVVRHYYTADEHGFEFVD